MTDWNYDLKEAPVDSEILVSYGGLVLHDCKLATQRRGRGFVDDHGRIVANVYAWAPRPLAASFNKPYQAEK